MNSKWNCTMYNEVDDSVCCVGYCKLDNMKCNRLLWSCKQYIEPGKTFKNKKKY